MRISDWSSDVCSSDLTPDTRFRAPSELGIHALNSPAGFEGPQLLFDRAEKIGLRDAKDRALLAIVLCRGQRCEGAARARSKKKQAPRSDERSVGKEGVSKCRSGWSPYHKKKKKKK